MKQRFTTLCSQSCLSLFFIKMNVKQSENECEVNERLNVLEEGDVKKKHMCLQLFFTAQ